jgi:hypothetical protein
MRSILKRIPGAKRLATLLGLSGDEEKRNYLLERLPQDTIGAEIGVHKGDFSNLILQILKPEKLYLIDPWKHEDSDTYKDAWYGGMAGEGQSEMDARYRGVLERFKSNISSGQVEVVRGFSDELSEQFSDEYFDWVYIDGNHLYEFVKKDLELYYQKTKTGGYITGDDYGLVGWWEDGVKKAVDEFVESYPVKTIVIKNHQFILQKTGP